MNPAQSEAAEVLAEWKAAYAEVFPHRNPEAMRVDDADLALAVMLRRKMRAAVRSPVVSLEPTCAAEAVAMPASKTIQRLSLGKIVHGPGVSPGKNAE